MRRSWPELFHHRMLNSKCILEDNKLRFYHDLFDAYKSKMLRSTLVPSSLPSSSSSSSSSPSPSSSSSSSSSIPLAISPSPSSSSVTTASSSPSSVPAPLVLSFPSSRHHRLYEMASGFLEYLETHQGCPSSSPASPIFLFLLRLSRTLPSPLPLPLLLHLHPSLLSSLFS
jgi:hypothetical protein